ncbi:MAG: metallophosphoesterase [Ktedonobacteraceae bacterium]|nr:metallophosphoesterase [Ktedonobacteraceae bacterium]
MSDDSQDQVSGNSGQDIGQPSSTRVPRRRFSSKVSSAGGPPVRKLHSTHPNQPFRPLPQPTGAAPYRMSLDQVLPADQIAAIQASEHVVFHIVGDTGGIKVPQEQQIVSMHMESDCEVSDPATRPSFFYHLGDVVYYYGEDSEYYPQFYEPYQHYPLPIFAIPGNHDGDIFDDSAQSLAGFVTNFCASEPVITKDAGDVSRDAMTQPNVYWTLNAPFVTIIGLYTNVPEGGRLDDNQINWFESELSNAPTDKALLVAMHHPIYSADRYHSGSEYMGQILEGAIQKTGRMPDAVFAGHVHNYQRFTRSMDDREVPFIVAGAGGYWHLHYIAKDDQGNKLQTPYQLPEMGVSLDSYCDDRHGYMRLEVSAQTLKGEYFAAPRPQESWREPAHLLDSFTLDLKGHRLIS